MAASSSDLVATAALVLVALSLLIRWVVLSVARRFRPSIGSMDVGVGPRLITETQSYDAASGERSGSLTDVRLASFARFALGQSELRGYLEVDAELSPARIRRVISIDPDLPSLPAWSVGVGAGLAWGQP